MKKKRCKNVKINNNKINKKLKNDILKMKIKSEKQIERKILYHF